MLSENFCITAMMYFGLPFISLTRLDSYCQLCVTWPLAIPCDFFYSYFDDSSFLSSRPMSAHSAQGWSQDDKTFLIRFHPLLCPTNYFIEYLKHTCLHRRMSVFERASLLCPWVRFLLTNHTNVRMEIMTLFWGGNHYLLVVELSQRRSARMWACEDVSQ